MSTELIYEAQYNINQVVLLNIVHLPSQSPDSGFFFLTLLIANSLESYRVNVKLAHFQYEANILVLQELLLLMLLHYKRLKSLKTSHSAEHILPATVMESFPAELFSSLKPTELHFFLRRGCRPADRDVSVQVATGSHLIEAGNIYFIVASCS